MRTDKSMAHHEGAFAIANLPCAQCEQRDPNCLRCTGQLGNSAAMGEDHSERMTPYEGDAGDETDGLEHCV